MQDLEFQICKILPGENLSSLDETDVETLFDFIYYIIDKNSSENAQFVTINGKRYKKVSAFAKRIM
jgi:hypothetical protein